MVETSELVFVTTSIYSKWLDLQGRIIERLFPNSNRIVVDGRKKWPNSWFFWIDKVKKSEQKYFIHLDEDFFITNKQELMKVFERIANNQSDLIGCSDGYHKYRGANPVAINSFFMCGKVADLKRISVKLSSAKYKQYLNDVGTYSWHNNLDIKYKESYAGDFHYQHKIDGGGNFLNEQEPYYAFLWTMKELGCRFDYLYPYFDERFKSTNPRLAEGSPDIGIHMWYVRQWQDSMKVWGVDNFERYRAVEKFIQGIYRF